MRLSEGQTTLTFIYGQVDDQGQSATVGVQKDSTTFEQCACSTGGLHADLAITFTLPPAPGPTPSVTSLALPFTDVHQSDYFYYGAQLLYGRGAISGYDDHTFRPGNSTTRGQLTKIIVRALGWAIDTSNGPHFTDVPADSPFYLYIETAFHHGIITGYADHTFLPGGDVDRAARLPRSPSRRQVGRCIRRRGNASATCCPTTRSTPILIPPPTMASSPAMTTTRSIPKGT